MLRDHEFFVRWDEAQPEATRSAAEIRGALQLSACVFNFTSSHPSMTIAGEADPPGDPANRSAEPPLTADPAAKRQVTSRLPKRLIIPSEPEYTRYPQASSLADP